MSVSGVVITALDPLRVHKGFLPDQRILPSLVVQVVAGSDEIDLRGDSGLRRRIVQLDAWATIETGADDYMEQARTKMFAATSFQVNGVNVSGAPDYDAEANLFRSSYEFIIWFNS